MTSAKVKDVLKLLFVMVLLVKVTFVSKVQTQSSEYSYAVGLEQMPQTAQVFPGSMNNPTEIMIERSSGNTGFINFYYYQPAGESQVNNRYSTYEINFKQIPTKSMRILSYGERAR